MYYDFLRKIPLFAELPEADLRHLCGMVEEVRLSAGEELFPEGSTGDRAYVVKEGQLEVLKASSGRPVLLSVADAGQVIGEMALLEERPRMASVRARTDCTLIAIQKEQLDHLLSTSASAAMTLFYTILERWHSTVAALREREKMAQLGSLTAGVAHELNNPAAAVKRGASQLQGAIEELERAESSLNRLNVNEAQGQKLHALKQHAQEQAARPPQMDVLARGEQEYQLESWLEAHGITNGWELAPALVNLDYDTGELAALAGEFGADLPSVVAWLNAVFTVHNLLAEVRQGSEQISHAVKALKTYSYLDQGPVQAVDVHQGLDDTLLILRHKLKSGISVRRDYAPDLPRIQGYGSELNQVWTNIIDNAADALGGQGTITIRTYQDDDGVAVEIEDDGPGIPPEVQQRLFEPFFTTKAPGQGTGLGLDISYNVVVHKHRGDIQVFSRPGQTRFRVWLPLNFEAV
jgi:signal transduction histidine kinase